MRLAFNKVYFGLTIALFAIEALIALYVHDTFVRPYFGDVLVVILIYCFVRSFLQTRVWPTALFVLVFAFAIEALQYANIVERLGLQQSKLACTVLGTSFAWEDIAAYIVGIVWIILGEWVLKSSSRLRDKPL